MIISLPYSFLPSSLPSYLHVGCIYIRDYVIYLHPRKTPVFPVLEIRLTGQFPVHRQTSMRNKPVIYASFPDLRIFSFVRLVTFTLENYSFVKKNVTVFELQCVRTNRETLRPTMHTQLDIIDSFRHNMSTRNHKEQSELSTYFDSLCGDCDGEISWIQQNPIYL